ncbi:hypothetical protein AGMMS49938_00520 [Fibrobacterales bacterium]|nr:hypothetical protein AGMMS49938_00520 [Fibrobacterales bacterium]
MPMLTPKFKLTAEQNIFLAKRNMVDYVYNSAKLEGCNVTFPETQTILNGVNVGSVTLNDIQTILNLRDAWKFLFANTKTPFDLPFICKINEYISRNESLEWGALRTGKVGISGTDYIPPVPEKEQIEKELKKINGIASATERAIEFFLWSVRAQFFWDGNKRTSTLCANKILIENGEGIFTVKDSLVLEFNKLLLAWYNTADRNVIKQWLYENCIVGMECG